MKVLDLIIKILDKLCAVALALMTVVTFAQAFNRYVLGGSFVWAEELSLLCMLWITFLGSTIAIRRGSHTRIDFAINMLPKKVKRAVEVIDYLLIALFCGYLYYVSLPLVSSNLTNLTPGMMIPRAIMYLSLTVGMACTVVYSLAMGVCTAIGYDPDRGTAKDEDMGGVL